MPKALVITDGGNLVRVQKVLDLLDRTDFTWHLRDLGIAHRRIPPGCPEVNGKVERSHRTDGEEFYRRTIFRTPGELAAKLRRWEHEYNHQRPHLALAGKTPAERMCELKITARTAQAMA